MTESKINIKKQLAELREKALFIRENINNKRVLKEYLNVDGGIDLASGRGDRMLDGEMSKIPTSRFTQLLNQIHQLSVDAMGELIKGDNVDSGEFDFFKKICDDCTKLIKSKKAKDVEVPSEKNQRGPGGG